MGIKNRESAHLSRLRKKAELDDLRTTRSTTLTLFITIVALSIMLGSGLSATTTNPYSSVNIPDMHNDINSTLSLHDSSTPSPLPDDLPFASSTDHTSSQNIPQPSFTGRTLQSVDDAIYQL